MMRSRLALGLLLVLSPTATACTPDRATPADCEEILARIVELEMREQGYADWELVVRKQREIRERFTEDIEACVGLRLPPDAMVCVREASEIEALTHNCLRRGAPLRPRGAGNGPT